MNRTLAAQVLTLLALSGCGTNVAFTPTDDRVEPPPDITVRAVDSIPGAPPLEVILEGPTHTPFDVAPQLLNREEVERARAREFAQNLRDDGLRGTVRIYFLLDPQGRVLRRTVHETSGVEALDAAGLRVATVPRFTPAGYRGEPVHVWISLPITFGREP